MSPRSPRIICEQYELIRQVQAWAADGRAVLGPKGRCRYCGETDPAFFRTEAHTFPEALGNKWVVSLDECDNCNHKFGRYDSALAGAVCPLLTAGGTKGKNNKVRQTGRSAGDAVLRQEDGEDARRRLAAVINDHDPDVTIDPATGMMRSVIPIAGVPFRPRHAYKALTKIGMALLPDEELAHFDKLRKWLLEVDDAEEFPWLEVRLSCASKEAPM